MEKKETLMSGLKEMIIESLELEEMNPEDISSTEPLFVEGLGLDSVDALQLVVEIEKRYGVTIEDEEVGKEAFASLDALSDFILSKQ